ncbi:hypothetical protein ACFXTI_004169 [Malus domestica]
MDRDREANTRCTWFIQIGYVYGVDEFSLIVKGLHKYIGSSSPLVDVTSSLEVLFLHPGVVSLTGGDAQGVPQVAELGDLPKEVTNRSIRPTQEFEGQNKSIKSRVRSTLMIWDTFAVDKADVITFLEAQNVEDEYLRAMPGKNKAKGNDREKA